MRNIWVTKIRAYTVTNLQAGSREHSDKNILEAFVAHLTAIDGKVFDYFHS